MGLSDRLNQPLIRTRELDPRGHLLSDAGWLLIAGMPGVVLGVFLMGGGEPGISFGAGLGVLAGGFFCSAGVLCLAYEAVARGGRVSAGVGAGFTGAAGAVLLAVATLPDLGLYRASVGAPVLLPFEVDPASLQALSSGLGDGALIVGGILLWTGIATAASALQHVEGWPSWVFRVAPWPGYLAVGMLYILLFGGLEHAGFSFYLIATVLGSISGFALGFAAVRMGRTFPAKAVPEEVEVEAVPAAFEPG